jgi:hypothetical protein
MLPLHTTVVYVCRCVFPHLHEEAAWEEFYSEFAAAGHDLDIWLQRKLLDDAMPDGMSAGMYIYVPLQLVYTV